MIRWVVIGIGDITTKRVLPAIQSEPRSELAGIVTRTPSKAEAYGVPGYTDLTAALKNGCDAVYVASPVYLHAPQTTECLRAGKHVLCEKPMAMNHPEACAMVRVAEESGRTLGIAYYRRMYPQVNRAKELIEAGAIGKPMFAFATSHDWYWPRGTSREWLVDPAKSGGGPLYDIASHRIDLMNYLFGQPRTAKGSISSLVHEGDVEDNATVMIEYESGARGLVDVRWHSRIARDEFLIRGTEGEIDMSPLNSGRLIGPQGEESLPPHKNLHYPCVENFVDAVLGDAPLRATGSSSAVTDWVTEQVLRGL